MCFINSAAFLYRSVLCYVFVLQLRGAFIWSALFVRISEIILRSVSWLTALLLRWKVWQNLNL